MNVLWNGIIVATGDVNVEMLTLNRPEVKKYIGILTSLNLHQHIQHPTRTIAPTKTLIDHIIGNAPNRASHRYVLPCPTTSDHDGPYACINVRVKLFQPHYNVKRAFFRRALSSNKPKELWNTKHRILHPSPQPIKADSDALNKHFSSISQRLLGSEANPSDSFLDLINSPPEENRTCSFNLRPVTYSEVMKMLTTMRSDCSTGADQI